MILNRLLPYHATLYIKRESYRLKEKRKAGILGLTTKAQNPKSEEDGENETL